jgi:hypothetical protein
MGVVLPRRQSRRTLEAVDVAEGSLKASVVWVEAQVDGMVHSDKLRMWGHHHKYPFLSQITPYLIICLHGP